MMWIQSVDSSISKPSQCGSNLRGERGEGLDSRKEVDQSHQEADNRHNGQDHDQNDDEAPIAL